MEKKFGIIEDEYVAKAGEDSAESNLQTSSSLDLYASNPLKRTIKEIEQVGDADDDLIIVSSPTKRTKLQDDG
jgi:hypothetical protein